jgi:tetratricopeptide (TPR) repeat protein
MPARHFTHDVFLSHNRAQKDWSRELAIRLRDAGFNVWFDEWSLRGGEVGSIGMERGLEESRHVVLVLSPEFIASEWTDYETQIALLLSPANRDRKLIPILHTKCDVPPRISRLNWIAFSDALADPARYEFRLAQLMSDLNPNRFERPTDFASFQANHKTSDPNTIPPARPLPPGSRMPQAPNPLFVGRENEMRDLNRMLSPGSGALVGVHAAVIGMGGVGKTQLAVEYAHRYGHLYHGGVFWLNFAGEEDPINEVARCGGPDGMDFAGWAEMKAPEQASRVQKAWEEAERASFLIFDNAEDPAAVEKWRPKHGHCSVLITCRRAVWPPRMGVKPLPIETLPREKSLELLAEARPEIKRDPNERQAASSICEHLGDLPLALTVAASYLAKYRSERLGEYLQALSAQPALQDSSLEKDLSDSFSISYTKLDPEDPTDALAQKLFYLASWFAPVSINRDLLIASAGVDSSDRDARHQTDDAVARLIELGLIKEETDKEEGDARLILHRLLRDFARLKTPEGMDQGKAIKAMGESLNKFANRENDSGLPQSLARERAHMREVANHAEHLDPALAARLYNELGANGRMLALFQEARADQEQALRLGEAALGPEHPLVAIYVNNLGSILQELGDMAGARTNFERALKIDEAVYGPEHPNAAVRLSNLGTVLRGLGDLAKARINLERALKIGEAAYGTDHPHIAIYVNNLGRVLQELGDLTGARASFERGLRIDEAVYGPEHPNVAIRLCNLGTVLRDLGDLAEARANLERALKIGEAAYGDDHPQVAIYLSNLGRILQKLGDLTGARASFERGLRIDEAVYGPEHPSVAIRLCNLGTVLAVLGDLSGARINYEQAVRILKKFLGDDHPNTRLVQRNLDGLTIEENKHKKSR